MENDWHLVLEKMTSKLLYLNSKTMYHKRLGEKHNSSTDLEASTQF